MGGGRALAGGMRVAAPATGLAAAPASEGTRVPLDDALKKLEGRGPFMSKLVAKLRAQATASTPATNLAGSESRLTGNPNTGFAGGLNRGFLGGPGAAY